MALQFAYHSRIYKIGSSKSFEEARKEGARSMMRLRAWRRVV